MPDASTDIEQSANPPPLRPIGWLALPVALLAAAAFLPVLGNGFVNWDDDVNFLTNDHFRGLGWAQIRWAWTTDWLGVYQPLAWMLFEAEYAIWGLDPRGYHLTSLVFHAVNAALLYGLTATLLALGLPRSWGISRWNLSIASAVAATWFMIHPLRVEVVAWASCQPYLPCACFMMLSIFAYLRADRVEGSRRLGWLTLAWLAFAIALLFKAVAVTEPAVLLILDVYPLRRFGRGGTSWRGVLAEKLPFVLISLIFMAIAIVAKSHDKCLAPLGAQGLSPRVGQACYGTLFYPLKTIWPFGLSPLYYLPVRTDLLIPIFLYATIAVVQISLMLGVSARRCPGVLAVWASYLVMLAPNSGLVRIGRQIAADRYSYVAMMGFVALLACGLSWLGRSRRVRWAIIVFGLAVGLGLAVLTSAQCLKWRTSEALWSEARVLRGPASSGWCGPKKFTYQPDAPARGIRRGPSLARRAGVGRG